MGRLDEIANHRRHVGSVFRIWSSHWANKSAPIPPIHFLRIGGKSDLFFTTGATHSEVSEFVNANQGNAEYHFDHSSDWPLSPFDWLGHWECFIATPENNTIPRK